MTSSLGLFSGLRPAEVGRQARGASMRWEDSFFWTITYCCTAWTGLQVVLLQLSAQKKCGPFRTWAAPGYCK